MEIGMKTGKMILTIVVSAVFLLFASILSQELFMGLLALAGVPAWIYHIAGGLLYAVSAYLLVWLYCTKYLKTRAFLLTGGEFGIESSVTAIVGYIVVSLAAVWMIRRRQGRNG